MNRRNRFGLVFALALGIAGGAGCSVDPSTGPRTAAPSGLLGLSSQPTLIQCPSSETQSATALIGPLGGVLAAGNTRVEIPADAVLSPTTFKLTVPASKYVEIEVTTDSSEHYLFAQPVVVSIDYGRCGRSNIDLSPLSAWNIDPATKALLEPMVSVDDKLLRTVTFSTVHFSGYAVAD